MDEMVEYYFFTQPWIAIVVVACLGERDIEYATVITLGPGYELLRVKKYIWDADVEHNKKI